MNTTSTSSRTGVNRVERYAQAAALLRRWLNETDAEDESDYDWDAIDRELNDTVLRCREPDPDERNAR